jgi:hypothetical protein
VARLFAADFETGLFSPGQRRLYHLTQGNASRGGRGHCRAMPDMAHGGMILKEMAMIINSQNLHKTGRLERNIAGARRCR